MSVEVLGAACLACEQAVLRHVADGYLCEHCGLKLTEKRSWLNFRSKTARYLVQDIGADFSIARAGLVGQVFTLAELARLREVLYADQTLASFAQGDYTALHQPNNALAQILLEQLRETCYIQINEMRRARGPILAGESRRLPQEKAPHTGLTWLDRGNLFLTNIRLVFPSDTFTFIRLDRKLVGIRAYENGLAIQRRGEDFATYFVGCRSYQAALAAAYIYGKVPPLRREQAER